MKNKTYLWIMTILAVGALWFLFHKPQVVTSQQQVSASNAPTVTAAATQASASNSAVQALPNVVTSGNSSDTNSLNDIAAKYQQGLIGKDQAMQAVILEENKKPLDMYGKVVDQYGVPISGVKVKGGVGLNVSMVESGGSFCYTETDTQGCFNFLGIHGVGIGIWLQKEGYFHDQGSLSGRPKDYFPDPNNPLVFKMWKIHGPEPLVSSSIDAKITPDGSSIAFDMETGKQTPNGNFQATLFRFPSEVKRRKYDWTAKIEMLNCGLLAENDPYPYSAPANGYLSSFEFNVSSNDVPWTSSLDKKFYIKNSQGQYGLMKLHINSSVTPARLKAEFTVNPSGSQNLEPDF